MDAAEIWSERSSTHFQSDSWKALHQIPVTKFLNHDSRPTFIFDLHVDSRQTHPATYPTYINPALCRISALFDIFGGKSADGCSASEIQGASSFLAWAKTLESPGNPATAQFGGFTWERITLDDRWRVVAANALSHLYQSPLNGLSSSAPAPLPDSLSSVDHLPDSMGSCILTSADGPVTPAIGEEREPRPRARQSFWHKPLAQTGTGDICPEYIKLFGAPSQDDDSARVCSNCSANNTQYSYDARIAKRNADLLAKIAAFEKVAIYIVDIKGEILFCSDAWYEICDHPRDQSNATTWINIFEDDEIPRMVDIWRRAVVNQEAVRYDVRLRRRWMPPAAHSSESTEFPTWISGWTYPDVSPTGETIGVCGVMTEISEQKWTEHVTERQLTDAIERVNLTEQLAVRARQVTESDNRFRRLSDMMPIGVWISDALGNVIYRNDAYCGIIPGSRDASKAEPWWEMVPQEHLARLQEVNRQLLEDHASVTFEVPLKRFDEKTNTITDEYRWVLISTYPELHQDGSVAYLTGCVTDITHLKVAEEIQGARAADALESKHQLEQFIDMTSHEMRNPLSAIVHSAEEILSSLNENDLRRLSDETISDAIEAAETIIYCAEHSTRIVDDILLVSKLESGLVDIAPTAVQPVRAIRQAWNMFSREMKASHITQSFVVDDSFETLGVDWVDLDMTRVLQVFVNLITNAIKFTRSEKIREITTCVKASLHRPTNTTQEDGVHYLDPQADLPCAKNEGDAIYLSITVKDTGCGLSQAEQGNLFQRFSQAGKRTHVKYGGTGLGLFISRKLCEMQNGQIGLRSKPREGSVFSFYVMAEKTSPPGTEREENNHHESTPSMKSSVEVEPNTSKQRDHLINGKNIEAEPSDRPSLRIADDQSRVAGSTSYHLAESSPASEALLNGSDVRHESTPQPLTVLLVEDNLINQKVVAKKLRRQGYIVPVANHGLEAIDCVRKSALWTGAAATAEPISLILLDLEMPVMDGLSCIRYIRESEKRGEIRCHVPVIAVTANARQEQINQAKEAGMDDVVTKPFRMEQLTTVIARLATQFPTTISAKP